MSGAARQLDREVIARLVPHAGAMCLLDSVRDWSAERIVCTAINHRDARNPLRADGQLAAVNGIEYAAQAMAVHGALLDADGGQGEARAGFLAMARDVALGVERLDVVESDLAIQCDRLMGDRAGIMYEFQVTAEGQILLSGRAMVMFAEGE